MIQLSVKYRFLLYQNGCKINLGLNNLKLIYSKFDFIYETLLIFFLCDFNLEIALKYLNTLAVLGVTTIIEFII